jgi:hypothetical protein
MVSVRTSGDYVAIFVTVSALSHGGKKIGLEIGLDFNSCTKQQIRNLPALSIAPFFLLIIISYYTLFQRNGGGTDRWTDRHTDEWMFDFNIFGSCRHFGVT